MEHLSVLIIRKSAAESSIFVFLFFCHLCEDLSHLLGNLCRMAPYSFPTRSDHILPLHQVHELCGLQQLLLVLLRHHNEAMLVSMYQLP